MGHILNKKKKNQNLFLPSCLVIKLYVDLSVCALFLRTCWWLFLRMAPWWRTTPWRRSGRMLGWGTRRWTPPCTTTIRSCCTITSMGFIRSTTNTLSLHTVLQCALEWRVQCKGTRHQCKLNMLNGSERLFLMTDSPQYSVRTHHTVLPYPQTQAQG